MTYGMDEHAHRFACWTAGTAIKRGWPKDSFSIARAVQWIEGGLKFLPTMTIDDLPGGRDEFDCWHDKRTQALSEKCIYGLTYGRAAKLANVYLKSRFVVTVADVRVRNIHPPIDRQLLKNLKAHYPSIKFPHLSWTTWNRDQYQCAITLVKGICGTEPLWTIERFWPIYADRPGRT